MGSDKRHPPSRDIGRSLRPESRAPAKLVSQQERHRGRWGAARAGDLPDSRLPPSGRVSACSATQQLGRHLCVPCEVFDGAGGQFVGRPCGASGSRDGDRSAPWRCVAWISYCPRGVGKIDDRQIGRPAVRVVGETRAASVKQHTLIYPSQYDQFE